MSILDSSEALPSFLYASNDIGVVTCATHSSSFVLANLDQHLLKKHNLEIKERQKILALLKTCELVQTTHEARQPEDYVSPIPGLPIQRAWRCDQVGSSHRYITTNRGEIQKHCRIEHGIKTGRGRKSKAQMIRAQSSAGYSQVQVQTLFKKTELVNYFIIRIAGNEDSEQASQQLLSEAQSAESSQVSTWGTEAAADLKRGYDEAQQEQLKRYEVVEGTKHVSELMAWLRSTRFQAHLENVNVEEIPSSYKVPMKDEASVLRVLCDSVARILRSGMEALDYNDAEESGEIRRVDLKLINTFERGRMSQDPIKPLQNGKSRQNYIDVFQQLITYIWNVEQVPLFLQKKMFVLTAGELKKWGDLIHYAEAWVGEEEVEIKTGENNHKTGKHHNTTPQQDRQDQKVLNSNEKEEKELTVQLLDEFMLAFCVEMLQHRLGQREFDSAIISFAAIIAWDSGHGTWKRIGDYTSYLSRIIYCCQLIAIRHCLSAMEKGFTENFTECYIPFRNEWLLNDSHSPMSTLLSFRLLGMDIGKKTVESTQIRWEANGERIVYKNFRLHMDELRTLVQHELDDAVRIFERDLCFGLDDIPKYGAADVVDNWQMRQPGASFITDVRNASTFTDGSMWLFNQVCKVPKLADRFLCRASSGIWHVDGNAVRHYETAVQQFLERMMVLAHIGSGQPARRVEFLGLRWCNRQSETRNIYIHDGHVLFILPYHKSLSLTNAARFPVRVFLPKVGELLIRYLVLVIPFRRWLLSRSRGAGIISEYLWADRSGDVWADDHMTRVLESRSAAAIGLRLTVQAWRQMAAGIAIQKFAGTKYRVSAVDDNGSDGGEDVEDERMEGAMPDAFHWQASHTPRVGNRAYGGTIDYNKGLTPAALQEFIYASETWHDFIEAVRVFSGSRKGVKHERGASDGILVQPLPKRIATRGLRAQCRRHWTMREAKDGLQQMYGPNAKYRTVKQEEAMQAVVSGLTPVVVILGTGEGKSLLYMLPQRLPGAGITVLLVPLIALKEDTIRKCRAMGIECVVWGRDSARGLERGLVIASLDHAVGKGSGTFQSYLHGWKASGQLGTVVVDECHLVITASSYRECMGRVKELRSLGVQFVFLSATLSVCMVRPLCETLLLSSPVIIRGRTVRRDIQYEVEYACTSDLVAEAVGRLSEALRVPWFKDEMAARAIVYCRTKDVARAVAEALGCPSYCADSGTDEDKADILSSWIEGDHRVIAATSAFVEGIDYPCVRIVFHIQAPDTAVEFAQGVGRAGRDGRDGGYGLSCVLLPKGWKSVAREANGELLDTNGRTMQQFLDYPRCRVLALSMFLDGRAAFCEPDTTACDRCEALGLVGQMEQDEETKR